MEETSSYKTKVNILHNLLGIKVDIKGGIKGHPPYRGGFQWEVALFNKEGFQESQFNQS